MKKFITIIVLLTLLTTLFVSMTTNAYAADIVKKRTLEDRTGTLMNEATGMMVNNNLGNTYNGNKVTLWSFDGTTDQIFKLVYVGDGKYLLYFRNTNKVVDVYRGNSKLKAGQKVDIWTDNDRYAQEFYLEKTAKGSYIFRMASNTSLSIGISGTSNGSQLRLVKYNPNDPGQRWYFANKNGDKVNPAASSSASSSDKYVYPLVSQYKTNYITQGFGTNGHMGTDFGTSGNRRTNVVPIVDGVVVKVLKTSQSGGYGNSVIVKSKSPSGKTFYSLYGHLASINVKVNQRVKAGSTIIGRMGNTGNSTNPHLHLAVTTTSGIPRGYINYNFSAKSKRYSGITYYNPVEVIKTKGAIIK